MISKLVKPKTNSIYLIGYLSKCIRPFVWIMPKIIGYVKTFIIEDKTNKLMLSLYMMRSNYKNIKLFGLRLKT